MTLIKVITKQRDIMSYIEGRKLTTEEAITLANGRLVKVAKRKKKRKKKKYIDATFEEVKE